MALLRMKAVGLGAKHFFGLIKGQLHFYLARVNRLDYFKNPTVKKPDSQHNQYQFFT
jgi:hypothetical protein